MTYIVKRVIESGYGDWTITDDPLENHYDMVRFAVYKDTIPEWGFEWYAVFLNTEDAEAFVEYKESQC